MNNPKGTCLTCHSIERLASAAADGMPTWLVQPVLSTDNWLPKSKFSHAQHANAACSSCHAAAKSKTSTDILIPPITTCRTCHIGTRMQNLNVTPARTRCSANATAAMTSTRRSCTPASPLPSHRVPRRLRPRPPPRHEHDAPYPARMATACPRMGVCAGAAAAGLRWQWGWLCGIGTGCRSRLRQCLLCRQADCRRR